MNGFWFIGNNQIIGLFYLRLLIWFEFESWLVVGGGGMVDFWLLTKVEILGFLDGLLGSRLFIWVWKLWVVGGRVALVILLSTKVQIFWFLDLRLLMWTSVLTIAKSGHIILGLWDQRNLWDYEIFKIMSERSWRFVIGMTEYPPLLNESKVLDFEAIMPIYVWFNYVSILWGNVEG